MRVRRMGRFGRPVFQQTPENMIKISRGLSFSRTRVDKTLNGKT